MANQKAEIIISARDETKIAFASVKNSLGSLGGITTGLSSSLGSLGPLLGAGAFTAFLKSGIDTLDMLGDLSDRTGVAASTLAGLKLVAAQSDTSLEALGRGINKLSIYMAENGDAAKKLGLDAKDPAEAFIQLSDALRNIEDPQQRAATANKVLGKSYQELLPALLQGGDALRKQIEAGKEFSNVTPEAVKQAQEFNNQLDLLRTKAEAAGVSLAGPLLSGINNVIKAWSTSSGVGFFGAFDALNTEEEQIGKKITETSKRLRDLQKSYDDLDPKKSITNKINDVVYGDRLDLSAQISVAKQELKTLQGLEDSRRERLRSAEKAGLNTSKSFETDAEPSKSQKNLSLKRDSDADAARRFVESLQKEVETLDLSKTALIEYEAAHLKLNATQKQAVAGLIDQLATQEKITQANKDQAEADEERRQMIAETVRSQIEFNAEVERIKDAADPTREYNRELEKLKLMYKDLRITAEEYGIAVTAAQGRMGSFSEKTKDEFEELKNAIDGFAKDATNSLVDFAFGASTSFEQMADDFAKAIAKMIIQKQLMEPLFDSIGLSMSSGSSSDLFGSLFGGLFSSAPDISPSASYGGILGMEGASSGGAVDWLKNLIPSFDVGTDYVPHDMLAMIHKGEKITPAAQNNGGSGGIGNVVQHFVLNTPADSRTQQQIAASAYSGLRRAAMRNS